MTQNLNSKIKRSTKNNKKHDKKIWILSTHVKVSWKRLRLLTLIDTKIISSSKNNDGMK